MRTCMHPWMRAGFLGFALVVGVVDVAAADRTQEDRSLRIIKRSEFLFPPELQRAGVTRGEVRLFLSVDANGKLEDHLIVAFTHHAFANEVSRTVARWRYQPAMAGGRAVACTVALNIRFETSGMLVRERFAFDDKTDPPEATDTFVFRARELAELDRVPQILFSIVPSTPVTGISGRVRVDFYIDETGHVRTPVVATADDERLGWAALAAIADWEFEVPTRGGHPVLARASQVFVFRPEE